MHNKTIPTNNQIKNCFADIKEHWLEKEQKLSSLEQSYLLGQINSSESLVSSAQAILEFEKRAGQIISNLFDNPERYEI